MTISAKTIEVEGLLPVHYLEAGAGNARALLLLSGGIGDAQANWQAVIPALAQEYHVFAPDLPGFGGSAPLPGMTTASLIHWLRALLDALDQKDVVIVGSFFGALLARLFAAAEPKEVPALVLINGGTIPLLPRTVVALARLPLIGAPLFRVIGRVACAQSSPEKIVYVRAALSEEFLAAWRANTSAFVRLMCAFVLSPMPAERTPPVPTLLLWGVKDQMLTLATAERLKLEIPGARLEPLADCGALPQLEASDTVAFQVSTFLDHLSRPTPPPLPGVGPLRSNLT